MKIERMAATAVCGGCGKTGQGMLLIRAVDTSPVLNTMTLCPECAGRLRETLGGFAAARGEDYKA